MKTLQNSKFIDSQKVEKISCIRFCNIFKKKNFTLKINYLLKVKQ